MNHPNTHASLNADCPLPSRRLIAMLQRLRLGFSIRRERRALAGLLDWQLQDLGLSREQATAESRRGLLDLPSGRATR